MTPRKLTTDNSVKYNHPANSSPGENSHDQKPKAASITRKQSKKLSQNN